MTMQFVRESYACKSTLLTVCRAVFEATTVCFRRLLVTYPVTVNSRLQATVSSLLSAAVVGT